MAVISAGGMRGKRNFKVYPPWRDQRRPGLKVQNISHWAFGLDLAFGIWALTFDANPPSAVDLIIRGK
jgi:hypothetical protein